MIFNIETIFKLIKRGISFEESSLNKLAERQGFEPWEGFPSTVFKTAAIDHSATSPSQILL